MPQPYKTHLSQIEQNLLSDVKKTYKLHGSIDQIDSLVVWGNRIVMAFSVNGQHYFLKQWPDDNKSEQEIAFLLTIQAYARKKGIPTPKIFKTINGEHILNWHERQFSLQEFVGTSYNPRQRSKQILSCAHTLCLIHREMADAQIGGKPWSDDPFSHAIHFIQHAKQSVPEHPLSSQSKTRVNNLLKETSDLLEQAKQQMLSLGWFDLPQIPIHGDYCQFNCRFEESQVNGVVDWDHARLGSRLIDIAHAINIGLGWRGSIDYYEDFLWQASVVPQRQEFMNWLTAYCRTAPSLSNEEIQLIPLICAALWPAPSVGFAPKCEAEISGCSAVVKYMRHFVSEAHNISKELKLHLTQ